MINLSQHDFIELKNLELNCSIGVLNYEKTILQKLKLDIKIYKDFSLISDNIAQTIDYSSIRPGLVQATKDKHFELLETLANFCADWINQQFQSVACEIMIKKYFIVHGVDYVGVKACRFSKTLSVSSR